MEFLTWFSDDEIENARVRAESAVKNGFIPRKGHEADCYPTQSFLHERYTRTHSEEHFEKGNIRTRTFECSYCKKIFSVTQIISEIDTLQEIFSKMPSTSSDSYSSLSRPRGYAQPLIEMPTLREPDPPNSRLNASITGSISSHSRSSPASQNTLPSLSGSANGVSLLASFQNLANQVRTEYEEKNAANLIEIEQLTEELEFWKNKCEEVEYERALDFDYIRDLRKKLESHQSDSSKEKKEMSETLTAMKKKMDGIDKEKKTLQEQQNVLLEKNKARRKANKELHERTLILMAEKDTYTKEKKELEEKLHFLKGDKEGLLRRVTELKEKNSTFLKNLNTLCADWQW